MRSNGTIYLDYQASTPVDPEVLAAMEASWRRDFANPHAAEHVLGWRAHDAIAAAAEVIAGQLEVGGDHVVFTSGATEANWLAITGLAGAARGERIIISATEHKSVKSAAAHAAARFGASVDTVGVDAEGRLNYAQLRELAGDDVALVSVMAVGNEVGAINNLREVRAACGPETLLHVDASQAAAALDLAEIADAADIVTLSSHKAYGPKGIGALVAEPNLQAQLTPLMPGGTQQAGLRPGTLPTPLCVGFARALALTRDLSGERSRIAALRDKFVGGLQRRCGSVCLIGPPLEERHPGNACVRIEGIDATDLLSALQPRIAASTQSACNSGAMAPSETLLALGLTETEARECVRFSLGRFTDETQVEEAIEVISRTISERRKLHRTAAATG